MDLILAQVFKLYSLEMEVQILILNPKEGESQMKAIWNQQVIADSASTVVVEGNHYFPKDSILEEFFVASETHTSCSWKGQASYYSVSVNGQVNKDAAWFYPDPKSAAKEIQDHVAFWKGVSIVSE